MTEYEIIKDGNTICTVTDLELAIDTANETNADVIFNWTSFENLYKCYWCGEWTPESDLVMWDEFNDVCTYCEQAIKSRGEW